MNVTYESHGIPLEDYQLTRRDHQWQRTLREIEEHARRWRLEDKLAHVLAEIEERAELDEQRRLAEERRAQERRRAHEQALERARERLVQAHRAKALAAQIGAWRLASEIRAFCAVVRERLPVVSGEMNAEDVGAWLGWAETYADQIDPALHPSGMPSDPEPTPEALRPFLDGWSPYLDDPAPWRSW